MSDVDMLDEHEARSDGVPLAHSAQDLEREKLVIAAHIKDLCGNRSFYISPVDRLLKMKGLEKASSGSASITYRLLNSLHCVDFADMSRELVTMLPDMLAEVTTVPASEFKAIVKSEARSEKKDGSRVSLKVVILMMLIAMFISSLFTALALHVDAVKSQREALHSQSDGMVFPAIERDGPLLQQRALPVVREDEIPEPVEILNTSISTNAPAQALRALAATAPVKGDGSKYTVEVKVSQAAK